MLEALEQQTIPDTETLQLFIYRIKLVGQLTNEINRTLRQKNQTTEILVQTQPIYNGHNCSNTLDGSKEIIPFQFEFLLFLPAFPFFLSLLCGP